MSKLIAGQNLFYVSSLRRSSSINGGGEEVTVVKVGRKWAELSNNYRIDLDEWIADGGGYSSPGRCYASYEEYSKYLALKQAWFRFKDAIDRQHSIPDGMTTEEIESIYRAIFK